MDILFRTVFNQIFIRKSIFYHVENDIDCKSIKYKYCYHLEWLIRNNHIELLRYKLKNNEYLYIDSNSQRIYQIKDETLFKQCFLRVKERIKNYSFGKDDPLTLAAQNQNYHAFKYLFEVEKYCNGIVDNEQASYFLGLVIKMGDIDLVKKCLGYIKVITSHLPFTCAIGTRDVEMIKLLTDLPKKEYVEMLMLVQNYNKILKAAMSTLDIGIFEMVRKFIEDSNVNKEYSKDQLLLWQLLDISTKSLETFRYMADNFDISFISNVITPPRLLKIPLHPFCSAVSYGRKDIILYLSNKGLTKNIHVESMASTALLDGNLDIYEFISNTFKRSQTLVPMGFSFEKMKYPPLSVTKELKYIFEVLKVPVNEHDLVTAATISLDVFKYIYELLKPDLSIFNKLYIVERIFQTAITNGRLDIITYMYQQGVTLNSVWIHIWSISNADKDPINVIKFLNTLIIAEPLESNHLTRANIPMILKCTVMHNFKVFKYLFELLYKYARNDKEMIIQILLKAAQSGRIKAIKYIYENPMIQFNRDNSEVIKTAVTNNQSKIVSYLLNNHSTKELKKDLSLNAYIIIEAINNNDLQCVECLVPLFIENPNKYSTLPLTSYLTISYHGNLLIIRYLLSKPEHKDFVDIKKVLESCKKYGYNDIIEVLKNEGYNKLYC